MEYILKIPIAISGDVVPLFIVADVMAKHAASGYGKLSFHKPTYEGLLPERLAALLSAAESEELTVCDVSGNRLGADKIKSIGASNSAYDQQRMLPIFVKTKHLVDWAAQRGDTFHIVDSPVQEIIFGTNRGLVGIPADSDSVSLDGPKQRQAYQEAEILRVINALGRTATALPKNEPGKPGVKAQVRNELQGSEWQGTVFNKAWERLRADKRIKNKA